MNNITIILYDISNNKLRRKIENTLKNYGVRLQYSVFYCLIDDKNYIRFRSQLEDIVEKNKGLQSEIDSILILNKIHKDKFDFIQGTPCVFENYRVY